MPQGMGPGGMPIGMQPGGIPSGVQTGQNTTGSNTQNTQGQTGTTTMPPWMTGSLPGMPPTNSNPMLSANEKDEKAMLLKLLKKYHPEMVADFESAEKNFLMEGLRKQLYALEHPDSGLSET